VVEAQKITEPVDETPKLEQPAEKTGNFNCWEMS